MYSALHTSRLYMGLLQKDFTLTTTCIQIIKSTVTLFVEHTVVKVPEHFRSQRATYQTYALYLGYGGGGGVLPLLNMSYLASPRSLASNDTAEFHTHHRQDAYKSSTFRSTSEMPKIVWPQRCVADEKDNSLYKRLSRFTLELKVMYSASVLGISP